MDAQLFGQIIAGVFSLIGLILTGILIPYFQSKMSLDQQTKVTNWIKFGLEAAEKAFELIPGTTEADKRKYVYDFLTIDCGIKIAEDKFNILLDAAKQQLGLPDTAASQDRAVVITQARIITLQK